MLSASAALASAGACAAARCRSRAARAVAPLRLLSSPRKGKKPAHGVDAVQAVIDAPAGSRPPRGMPASTADWAFQYRDVVAAQRRIGATVRRTPLDYSARLSKEAGCELYFKKEHISVTGSYKERGALNKILSLTPEQRESGVICASAGNHAQAVAYHSTRLGISSTIVMPETTPVIKVRSTENFGGNVVLSGRSFGEALERADEISAAENRAFVHAFNDPLVCAGQGTVAMEMLEQNPYLDAVIVPIGGGGLVAGMGAVLKAVNPRIRIIGVEAEAMPGMLHSTRAGHVVSVPRQPTVADGIAIERIGDVPFSVIKDVVDDIVTVSEDEMAAGVLALIEMEKTVVEGSGASGLAALMSGRLDFLKGQNVCSVLTGGNIDLTLLGRILDKGLVQAHRLARIRVTIMDTPGSLNSVLSVLAKMNCNIRDVAHERAFLLSNVHYTQPVLTVETKGASHMEEIVRALKDAGFSKTTVDTV